MILGLKKIFNKACRKAFAHESVRQLFATDTRLFKIGFEQASRRDLENGIKLDYKTAPDSNTTRITLNIDAGAYLDPPGKEGLAHAVEHMLFMSRKANDESLLQQIRTRGGKDRARVGIGETRYELELPRTGAHETLLYDTLAKTIFAPRFDPDDLELEKEVLINELLESMDSKNDLVYDFVEKSYGRGRSRVAGTEEGIRSLSVADLEAFHAQYYVGRNARITINGAPALTQTEAKLKKAFAFVPAGAIAPPRPSNVLYSASNLHKNADTRQTEMRVFLPMVHRGNDFETKKALLLADYIADQLDDKLRSHRHRITYSPQATLDDTEGNPFIDIDIKSRPCHMSEIAQAVVTIITDIADSKIDEESWHYVLERRKNTLHEFIKNEDAEMKAPFDKLQDKAYHYKSQTILDKMTPYHIIGTLHESLELGLSLATRGQAAIPGAYEALRRITAPRENAELIADRAHLTVQPQSPAVS